MPHLPLPNIPDFPWWNWALQCLGVVTAYWGAELNARMNIRGFQLWIVSNIALLGLHAATGMWVLCALDVAFFRINARGIRQWREKASG